MIFFFIKKNFLYEKDTYPLVKKNPAVQKVTQKDVLKNYPVSILSPRNNHHYHLMNITLDIFYLLRLT